MYQLKLAKSRFYRVKRGQTAQDIEQNLCVPVHGNIFEGKIIPLPQCGCICYKAQVGDTYFTLSQKFGIDAEELKSINENKPVYPTCRLYIPCK